MCEDADGNELEWDQARNAWVPAVRLALPLLDWPVVRVQLDERGELTPSPPGRSPVICRRLSPRSQLTDEVVKQQQAAYSVAGVDEEVRPTPTASLLVLTRFTHATLTFPRSLRVCQAPVAAKEDKKGKKRKAAADGGDGKNNHKKARGNTAVFVSSLPQSTTASQLVETFSKAGLILEDVNGEPKVKLYKDADGRFKGEALIVYLQEASVELACRLFDETELVLGSGEGTISVKEAQWDNSKKSGGDKGKESAGQEGGAGQAEGPSKGKPDQQKARQGKKAAALRQCVDFSLSSHPSPSTPRLCRTKRPDSPTPPARRKLGDWSDDEDPAAAAARARKYRGVVVLEGMFTLQELEEDATLLLDLKEDVREECETIGEVTNVTLYDVGRRSCPCWFPLRNVPTKCALCSQKEDKGVMTVRFKDELAAQACIAVHPLSFHC